jgi:AbrB family looped-hinge helix DNA binding protein
MKAHVEIDKAGRIVIPKKMRDALRLKPGSRLRIERHQDQIRLEPDPASQPVRKLELPIIRSNRPGTLNLTNEQIDDILLSS